MSSLVRVAGISVALGVVFACADGRPPPSPSLTVPAGGAASGADGPQPSATACEDSATHVYVISGDGDLHRFRPRELAFERVGQVTCDIGVATPNSMAVDRFGIAYVNYWDGGLFRVGTTDARCGTLPQYQPGQSGLLTYGMAFTKTSDTEETLFVDDAELAMIDTNTAKLTPLVAWQGALAGTQAELTGTADGRLYGFFTTKPNATLVRIDPKTGSTSEERVLEGVDTGVAWAFSFWGGDFWFYTAKDGAPSAVTRLHTDTGELEVVVPDVGGFQIVGAGVSTCAPLSFGPR